MLCAVLTGVCAAPFASTQAADPSHFFESVTSRALVVTLYKSRTIHLDRPFATAVVGSPDIADALPMTDRGLYIQGKKIGTTNVSVFDQDQKLVAVVDLEVALDSRDLQSKIAAHDLAGARRAWLAARSGRERSTILEQAQK